MSRREGDSLLARIEHGIKGAPHGIKGAEHGVKGGRPKADVIDFADAKARRLTAAQIADEHGVSERTVQRQAKAWASANDAAGTDAPANDVRRAADESA